MCRPDDFIHEDDVTPFTNMEREKRATPEEIEKIIENAFQDYERYLPEELIGLEKR